MDRVLTAQLTELLSWLPAALAHPGWLNVTIIVVALSLIGLIVVFCKQPSDARHDLVKVVRAITGRK